MEDTLSAATSALSTYIEHNLASGSKLARVARAMMVKTERWYAVVHKFFDMDLQTLKDQGIPAPKILILISEYVIIIFDARFRKMQELIEFSPGTIRAD